MKSILKGIVVTALCTSVVYTSALASSNAVLIVPGKQLGQLHLKSYPKGLPLGKPDYSDAGMNHETLLYESGKKKKGLPANTLLVETTSNAPIDNETGYTLHYIRVTSPVFQDRHGLKTGSTLASIRRFYHHLTPWDSKPTVLADNALGISFEFSSAHPKATSACIAIAVYEPGGGVWADYNASDVRDMVTGKDK